MQKKILIAIIIAVLVIAIGGAFLWMQKSPTPAVDEWKTYTNTEYGFEFKYPKGWLLETYDDNNILVVLISLQNEQLINQGKVAFANFSIEYYRDANEYVAKHVELEQRLNLKSNEYKNLDDLFKWLSVKEVEELTIGGKKGYVVAPSSDRNYVTWIENNGIYKLNFPSIDADADLGDTEKNILSTFKFTN